MGRPDKQYVALATLDDGSVQLVDYRQPEGQTHMIVRKAGDGSRLVLDLGDIIAPLGVHDALKISRVTNAEIVANRVVGGSEDVVDITWSKDVFVVINRAEVHGKYLATIKGGCNGVRLDVAEQVGHGGEADYDLGNWFDYNKAKTTNVILVSYANETASVRVLNADKPSCSGNFKVNIPWWRPLYKTFYPILKKIGIV